MGILIPSGITLSKLLTERANNDPELTLYRFLSDGDSDEEKLTCWELHQSAATIASRLRELSKPGDRVLLLAAPGLDFIRGFFAIQYAGLIATTTFPPHPRRADRTLVRLKAIVTSCQPSVILSTNNLLPVAEQLGVPTIDITSIPVESVPVHTSVAVPDNSPALLQYTSGSTVEPKGVILTHRNVLNNLSFIAKRFGHSSNSVGVIWLPPYHDMGLIGGILQPLYAGFPVILLNPLHVLQRPVRWLAAITQYHGTTSGGPNFAYEHCIDSISDADKANLDLSSWQVAFCGAETVRPSTWRRFSAAYACCGFRKQAFFPCYGLAESTLMVTGAQHLVAPTTTWIESSTEGGKTIKTELVSCGTPSDDHKIKIVATEVGNRVGEIWVQGPSVSPGYWKDDDATLATFISGSTSEESWLRTGDLGFIENESLFVTGRCKDLIILSGRNLYPQDLEVAIEECHPMLQANGACAFSIEQDHQEKLIIVSEVRLGIRKMTAEQKTECSMAVRKALGGQFDVSFHELWFVKTGSIPRTLSGKKRRAQARELYLAQHFQHEDIALADFGVSNNSRGIHDASLAAKRLQRRLALIMVIVPVLGLFAAIWLAWGTGIQTIDLVCFIGFYIATVLGVEVGFHRHFSHRAFQAPAAVRTILCILGSMAAQGPVLFWVATHRRHHAFSDQAEDPHSPNPQSPGVWGVIRGLWHAHVGWLFRGELTNPMQYGPDIFRDRLIFRLNQFYPLWVMLGLALPALAGLAISGTWMGAARGLLWGGLVRIFFVHHATWSVNSICHVYGQRAYETRDESRNNAWLVLSSLGGSWHNNHHAFPNSAFTGIRRWEFDPSGWLIRLLAWTHLASEVKTPSSHERSKTRSISTKAAE